MLIKVIHLDRDVERLGRLRRHYARTGLDYELFPAVYSDEKFVGIAQTMHNVAVTAVGEGWDPGTVVCQDDVRWPRHIPEPSAPLTVYGTLSPSLDGWGHICPRAFCATPAIWQLLLEVFDGVTKACDAWRPVVEEHGVILNIVFHPDVPRAQEPVRPLVSSAI